MKLLLDTHVLLWAAAQPERLPPAARELLLDRQNELLFSAASIWEVSIKRGLGRDDFCVDGRLLRRGLLDNGYGELAITAAHALGIEALPALHKDPFDRMLVAQAQADGLVLATSDAKLAAYGAAVRVV